MKRVISTLMILMFILGLIGCDNFPHYRQTSAITDESLTDVGLRAHFIDVGQGDSILLESEGEYALIDAGEYKEREKVISYLSDLGVSSIKYVISTHPHADHCGGLSEVIREFDCENFICGTVESDSDVWEYVLDAVDERNVSYITPNPGENYILGSSTISILSPYPDQIYSSMNNYSIVCKVSYKNTSMLFTGDAEELVEDQLIRSHANVSANVIKCGHHGSSSSTTEEFLLKVNPDAAIISCGEANEYGHPHAETLDILESYGIPYWRTDNDGTVLVSSNGTNISVKVADDSATHLESVPLILEESTPVATEAPTPTALDTKNEVQYIGNRNSKIFHRSTCGSVQATKEKNKIYFDSRDEAVLYDYTPCKSCNP